MTNRPPRARRLSGRSVQLLRVLPGDLAAPQVTIEGRNLSLDYLGDCLKHCPPLRVGQLADSRSAQSLRIAQHADYTLRLLGWRGAGDIIWCHSVGLYLLRVSCALDCRIRAKWRHT